MHRPEKIETIEQTHYDVAIIGGGITGAGIFLKCCQLGYKTVLVDQADFAGGTSSRSAKMIHGGLRYLQYLQVKLVKEALEEREYLLEHYSHLVRPLPFLLPIYHSRFNKVKMKVGLSGYDALAGKSRLPKHRSLNRDEVREAYPMLKDEGLKGGFYYFDAITNDARLTNEVIMQGCRCGGLAMNYVNATLKSDGEDRIDHLEASDELTGRNFKIRASAYISAAGVWTDEVLQHGAGKDRPLMKPSKGVHIVVDGSAFPEKDVLLIPCQDKRFIWICPWEDGLVLIGATDTPFEGDIREPGTTEADVQYLLDNANRYLKGIALTEDDILSVYSGLRPLLNDEDEENTVKMSRDYKVWWDRENLLAIAGGKLTSFLSMADHVVQKLKERTAPNGDHTQSHAMDTDAAFVEEALSSIRKEAEENKESITDRHDHDNAEIVFFVRYQHVEKISDVLSRRLAISYGMKTYDERTAEKTADVLQRELRWPEEIRQQRLDDYRRHWETLHSWTKST